ncbi:MAG: hypothetical protein ACFFEF_15640 [Candidatus Thorarchaeota archaeon]
MNSESNTPGTHNLETESVEGVVIGMDFGSWSGFDSGKIILKSESDERMYFHYGKHSLGDMPRIGDLVCISYTGVNLFEICKIEILEMRKETAAGRASAQMYALNLLFGRPKAAVAIALTEVFVGICIIIIGLILGFSKPAAPFILGVVGMAQIGIAWLIWEYTGKG